MPSRSVVLKQVPLGLLIGDVAGLLGLGGHFGEAAQAQSGNLSVRLCLVLAQGLIALVGLEDRHQVHDSALVALQQTLGENLFAAEVAGLDVSSGVIALGDGAVCFDHDIAAHVAGACGQTINDGVELLLHALGRAVKAVSAWTVLAFSSCAFRAVRVHTARKGASPV